MKSLASACALVVLASTGNGSAQGLDRRQLNELQEQFTTCAVFYEVSGTCVGSSDPQLAMRMSQSADLMRQGAIMLGTQVGLSGDAMVSRQRMIMRQFRDVMQSDCVNISSILHRHAQACRRLSEAVLRAR